LKSTPDTYEVVLKGEAKETTDSTSQKSLPGKKIGVGVALYFIPGLGQLINGQPKKLQASCLELLQVSD